MNGVVHHDINNIIIIYYFILTILNTRYLIKKQTFYLKKK